jgi:hypothetical protein
MEQINNIKNRLHLIKDTHPNLYTLWNTYIDEKTASMYNLITECRNFLNKIENDNLDDLAQENMFSLLMFMSLNNESDMT